MRPLCCPKRRENGRRKGVSVCYRFVSLIGDRRPYPTYQRATSAISNGILERQHLDCRVASESRENRRVVRSSFDCGPWMVGWFILRSNTGRIPAESPDPGSATVNALSGSQYYVFAGTHQWTAWTGRVFRRCWDSSGTTQESNRSLLIGKFGGASRDRTDGLIVGNSKCCPRCRNTR